VLHDYSAWEAKLSPRGVVVFHDITVHEGDFGVWRFWDEIRTRYPSFAFFHAHGLGVLARGPDVPAAVARLCSGREAERIRERFAALGERWVQDFQRRAAMADSQKMHRVIDELSAAAEAAHQETIRRIAFEHDRIEKQAALFEQQKTELLNQTLGLTYDVENLRNDLSHAHAQIVHSDATLAHSEATIAHSEATIAHLHAEQEFLNARLAWAENAMSMLQVERDILLHSTLWQVLLRLKRIAFLVPQPVRGLARRMRRGISPRVAAPLPSPQTVSPEVPPAPQIAQPAPKLVGIPKPVAPARQGSSQRIVFISGEPETPGHDYRVLRAVHAAGQLGWQAQALTVETATNERLDGADIVVIWRATWSSDLDRIFAQCRKTGAVTIFDVDDLMFRPELARAKLIDGIRSQGLQELDVQRFYVRINQSVRAADLCSCTTRELASHLRLFKKPSFVIPNSWDMETWRRSRLAVRTRRQTQSDGLIRIGYASGTRTHQKDFAVAAEAVARLMRENERVRLVLFRDAASHDAIVIASEFEALDGLAAQIEWRDKVALCDLAGEIVRFDINIAPLEVGNPFCEAKSELKYWEAALVDVPTVASPTGPYARAIEHGRTGLLATTTQEWHEALSSLVRNAALRARMAHAAQLDVLWRFGPLHHNAAIGSMLDQAKGGRSAARAMLLDLLSARTQRPQPVLPERETVFEQDRLGQAEVTVIVPVYNYAHYVIEALDSVAAQTAQVLDLVIVEDCSKDGSLAVVTEWARAHADRFNRILVIRHIANAGLGFARNTGFDAAETPFVLPLDADNMLRPECCAQLAARLRHSGAAFAYPTIRRFGKDSLLIGDEPFLAARLVSGNYIDAMALVRRDAWAASGGYDHVRFGWEDFDFWCRLVELGLWGEHVQEVLADYRAHEQSMLHTQTDLRENKIALIADMKKRHDWLDMAAMTL